MISVELEQLRLFFVQQAVQGLAVQPQQPQKKHIKIEMTESASSDSTTAIAAIDPRATEKNVKLIKRSPVLT